MKQPKNSLLAIMVLVNIVITLFILFQDSNVEFEKTVSAQEVSEEVENANRRKIEEVNPNAIEEGEEADEIEEADEKDILYRIKGVTNYDSEHSVMPLYYHHSNKEGAWFIYKPIEEGEAWEGGYWFIDYQTLEEANIQHLAPNDVVQGVFYDGEYFEIKETVAVNK